MQNFNWGTFFIGLIVGAIAVWAIGMATKPATGTVTDATYTGTIVSINKAEKAGKIAGDGVGGVSVQEYQFQIPGDLAAGYTPVVGDKVNFDVSPYQAQDVSNVRKLVQITCTLDVTPRSITLGRNITFSWVTTGLTSASIDLGVGGVSPVASGTRDFLPSSTGTFTFTLTGTNSSGGSCVSNSVTVEVLDDR